MVTLKVDNELTEVDNMLTGCGWIYGESERL